MAPLSVVFPRSGPTGGVERVVHELLRHRADVEPVRFVGRSWVPIAGVEHVPVPEHRGPAALSMLAFRRSATRAVRPLDGPVVSMGVECPPGDLLWVHSVHAAWLARGGQVTFRGRSVPAGARRLLPIHRALVRLERDYFRRGRDSVMVCTSDQEVADLGEFYGVDPARTRVLPNGVDLAVLNPARRQLLRAEVRDAWQLGAEEVSVLLVANEWHRKGLSVLLAAVAMVGDPRLRLDLVGAREPRQHWALVAELGLRGRVHWHGATDEVIRAYAAADIAVLPSSYEPFGIVVIEAMAAGLPVVVSALAGASRAVTAGVDGLVLGDPHDPVELGDRLRELLSSVTRERLGSAAAVTARGYAWRRVLGKLDPLLDSLG